VIKRAPIQIVTQAPDLSRDGNLMPLIDTIRQAANQMDRAGTRLALIVVDTLHAVMGGGDENSAADVGHALRPFQEAVERLGLFTLICHHPGKEVERGARGSSSLAAAVDTSIELRVPGFGGPRAKPASMVREATIIKQRDGGVGDQFHYRLPISKLGVDEDGDDWTTCTVMPCAAPALDNAGKLQGKADLRLTTAIEAALSESGSEKAEMRLVRRYFNNAGPVGEKDDARRKAFRRAFEKACQAGLIETDANEEFVWLSSAPAPAAGQADTP
jgi:hypothetical protein